MLYLSKVLPLFVLPLGITLIVSLVGLVFRRRWLIWVAVVLLWVSSTPLVGGSLIRAAEQWAERAPAAQAPVADAIVVLSVGRITAPGRAAISEWTDPDRFFAGIELFNAGKAPVLVFTDGPTQGYPKTPLEGEVLAKYAKEMGVPPDRIIITAPISNTADEAREVGKLLRGPRATTPQILLVTSAFHMPRAKQMFERAGMSVAGFPVDFSHGEGTGVGLIDFLPNASSLVQTQTAMRELYGRLFYLVYRPR